MISEARDLREIREALREYEDSQLADTARVLLEVAERLTAVADDLDDRPWLSPKRAAEYLDISESQFKSVAKQIERRYVSTRLPRYRREWLDDWMDRRDEYWNEAS